MYSVYAWDLIRAEILPPTAYYIRQYIFFFSFTTAETLLRVPLFSSSFFSLPPLAIVSQGGTFDADLYPVLYLDKMKYILVSGGVFPFPLLFSTSSAPR